MSVAKILVQIKALPTEQRLELTNKLVEIMEAGTSDSLFPPMTEAERLALEENLKQRPNLKAELTERINQTKAGYSIDLEEVKALLRLSKMGL